jgi:rhamnose utilization protein RhaD (predicted bifunctional aldolase and dehydrogenase)/NAD(P)-dependent dehydrogenase (short-subunit alcohol dehydrogenase family)
MELKYLKDLWDEEKAAALAHDPLELLRYRSNLLGADLRNTNFGGGNTSSKIELPDLFTGLPVQVLAVKGSGGDLGSIKKSGFALVYMDKLEQLVSVYRGEDFEDEMVALYPPAAFGANQVAASIDTPLHGLLPFPHIDHLHPDWAIAVAASANGKRKLEEFNREFGHKIAWVPWQRPGFELGMMLRSIVSGIPDCDGVLLGGHGLFTWGQTQRDCYLNSIGIIDQMGQFVAAHAKGKPVFGGARFQTRPDREQIAAEILPALRGVLATTKRTIAHYADSEDALEFVNSAWAPDLSQLGTSCPDHFLRTRIRPLFLAFDPQTESVDDLKARLAESAAEYRGSYGDYYTQCAEPESPKLRDANPSVVLIPGLGLFAFGRNKKEARITAEFFINAIHVMAGATALDQEDSGTDPVPQARRADQASGFKTLRNYVSLPLREAFRIEYWALEEAKLQRMPPEQEFSRKIAMVAGAGSGIGRLVAIKLAQRGAHVVVADRDAQAAEAVAAEIAKLTSAETVMASASDITNRESIRASLREVILKFGGLDILVNTAAMFPVPGSDGKLADALWAKTFDVNIKANYNLAEEARWIFDEQKLHAAIVLTSSANAVVPKFGSEAYDVSKSAVNALIREMAVGMAPNVRVNGIAPATVVAGSAMFPRDRVASSLSKYRIAFSDDESTEELRDKLARFYAQRTLTKESILPGDCAEAIVYLAGDLSAKTTGHIIPVDGGLPEAFLR